VGESDEIIKFVVEGITSAIGIMTEVVNSNERLSGAADDSLKNIESMYTRFSNTVSVMADAVKSSGDIEHFIKSITSSLAEVNSALELSKSQTHDILTTASFIREEANGLKERLAKLKDD
jgi:methyl-accepting chemotaxis protein